MLPAQSLTLGLRSSVLDKTSCYLVGPQLVARDVVPVQSSQGPDGTRDIQGSPLSLPICPHSWQTLPPPRPPLKSLLPPAASVSAAQKCRSFLMCHQTNSCECDVNGFTDASVRQAAWAPGQGWAAEHRAAGGQVRGDLPSRLVTPEPFRPATAPGTPSPPQARLVLQSVASPKWLSGLQVPQRGERPARQPCLHPECAPPKADGSLSLHTGSQPPALA